MITVLNDLIGSLVKDPWEGGGLRELICHLLGVKMNLYLLRPSFLCGSPPSPVCFYLANSLQAGNQTKHVNVCVQGMSI